MTGRRRTLYQHTPPRRSGGDDHGESGSERWMISYADFITVLMALFLVLYAISEANSTKFAQVAAGLRAGFYGDKAAKASGAGAAGGGLIATGIGLSGGTAPVPLDSPGLYSGDADSLTVEHLLPVREPVNAQPAAASPPAAATASTQPTEADVLRGMQRTLTGIQVGGVDLSTYLTERGLVISIVGRVLFDPGSDTLRPAAQERLKPVVAKLRSFDHSILIEGHPAAGETPAGMQPAALSSRRAVAIVEYLASQQFPAARMVAVGYGEVGADTGGRVDIIVLSKLNQ